MKALVTKYSPSFKDNATRTEVEGWKLKTKKQLLKSTFTILPQPNVLQKLIWMADARAAGDKVRGDPTSSGTARHTLLLVFLSYVR